MFSTKIVEPSSTVFSLKKELSIVSCSTLMFLKRGLLESSAKEIVDEIIAEYRTAIAEQTNDKFQF